MTQKPFAIFFENHHIKVDVIKYGTRLIENWDDAVLIRPYWRIFWAEKKGASFHHLEKSLNLDDAHLTVIPPYLEVEHELLEEVYVFHLNIDIGKPFYSYKEIFQVSIGQDYLDIIHKIINDPYDESFVRQSELNILVMKMMSSLNVNYFDAKNLPEKVTKVVQYMEEHYDEYLHNKLLAEMIGVSVNSFIRMFTQATQVSPQEYLRNVRLDASVNLLIKTKLDIDEISRRCGFTERNYFSRVFSKRFKMGPAQYRKVEI